MTMTARDDFCRSSKPLDGETMSDGEHTWTCEPADAFFVWPIEPMDPVEELEQRGYRMRADEEE